MDCVVYVYGVNRFYYGKRKVLESTDWFFSEEDALFATTQDCASKHIIKGIYHDDDETGEPWIEITENIDRT